MKSSITGGISRTNRRFFLLGACGILAITVIQVPSVADLWEQVRSQHRARGEMVSTPDRLTELNEQLESVQAQLRDFELAMVGMDLMPTIQSELMELARGSGCQLRKAVIQAGATETWEPEKPESSQEELEAELADPAAMSITEQESPYRLSTEQLSLSLTGSLKQTFDFLDRIQERKWLMRVAQISFSRDADGADQLVVEASLAFHKLVRHSGPEVEAEPWREGSR
jgi:hypothetical protein